MRRVPLHRDLEGAQLVGAGVHHDGDGFFLMELAGTMTRIVGQEKVTEMIETSKHTQPLSLEWWQEKEAGFDRGIA